MDEVEAVAQAIEDQLTAEDGWMVGTPALSSMCHDFAQAAAAVIAADRAGLVARIVELEECLRKIAAPRRDWETPAKHSEWCRYFARAALKDTRHD